VRPKLARWQDGDVAELQRLVSSAELDQPSAEQLARLSGKLESALGPEWSGGGEPSASEILQPSVATTGAALKGAAGSLGPVLAVTTAIVLGLGAAYFGLRQRPEPPPPVAASTPLHSPAAGPLTAPSVAPLPEPAAVVAPAAAPSEAPAPKPAPSPRAARPEPRGGGLSEELKQLEAIRRTLAHDPGRALTATDRHARRFPQGALRPERELLKIEALLRLGRSKEAWQLASRALAKPHPYQAQILQLMAAHAP